MMELRHVTFMHTFVITAKSRLAEIKVVFTGKKAWKAGALWNYECVDEQFGSPLLSVY